MSFQMQARSGTDGALYTWVVGSPDFAAAGYPGPGAAQDVAVAMRPAGAGVGGGVTDHGLLTGNGDDDHVHYELARRPLQDYTAASNDLALADARKCVTATRATAIALRIRLQASVAWLAESLLGGINVGAGTLTITAEGGVTLNGSVTVPQNGWWWAKRTALNTWQCFTGGSASSGDFKADGSVPATGDFDLVTHALKQVKRLTYTLYNGYGSSGAAKTIVAANGDLQALLITANCTVSFTLDAPCSFTVLYRQNGTGGWTLTHTGVTFAGGAPAIATAIDAVTAISYLYDGTTLYGAAGAAGVGDFKADGTVPLTGDLNAGGNQLSNLGAPAVSTDAATKGYVDAASGGGGGRGFRYTFSATTTDADPGAGTLRLNNATLASATQIFLDLAEFGTTDVTAWLDSLDDYFGAVKGILRLQSRSDATKWIEYAVTGWTTATGYRKLTIVYVAGPGGLLTTAGDTFVSFDSTSLSTVPICADAFRFTYSATTTDADPGAGTLRMSSGTIGSVVTLYVDLAEHLGTDITAWLDSLDDSGAAILGRVRLQSLSDATKWAVFNLTAWTTASGYRKLTVAYVAGPGGFTTIAGDTLLIYDRGIGSGNFGAGDVQTSGKVLAGTGGTPMLEVDTVSGRRFVGLLLGATATATELPVSGGSQVLLWGASLAWPTARPDGNSLFTWATHDSYGISSLSKNGVERTIAPSGSSTGGTRKLDRVDLPAVITTGIVSTSEFSGIEADINGVNGSALPNGTYKFTFQAEIQQTAGSGLRHCIEKKLLVKVSGGTPSAVGTAHGDGINGDASPPSVGTIDVSGTLIRGRIALASVTATTVFARMSISGFAP